MTVSIEGVDYSYARPTPAGLKAAGKHFAVRYITNPGRGNKGIDAAEYGALKANGVAVVVVYEATAGGMKNGRGQGVTDAKAAEHNLKNIAGLGDNLPVYFACDWDATPGDQTAINAYLDGAASVIGRDRVGIYGGYYPVKRARDAKKATWLWQTYAWSGGQVLSGIHLYQYKNGVPLAGGTVDLCRALQTEYGQHNVGAVEAPKPATPKPATSTPAPKPAKTVDTAAEENLAEQANKEFDPSKFNIFYYFKGTNSGDVFVYNPLTGHKRHVTAAEWSIVKGFGHDLVYVLPQSEADQIPS